LRLIAPAPLAVALSCLLALGACQSGAKTGGSQPSGKSASLRSMETVAIAAHKCWFASNDPAFRPYRMANELNSMTGTPRFLLVPAKNYGGLPLLVVQASGNSSRVDVFGPLMDQALGARIGADVKRWAGGESSCGASA
jgi:hypothetical protein